MTEQLRPESFEVCFADEPAGPVDVAADVARGKSGLRRRRALLGGAAAGGGALAFLVAALNPALPITANPISPLQPAATPELTPTPAPTTSTALPFQPNLPDGKDVAGPDPDPTRRGWLLPPDSPERIYYSSEISDPPPAAAHPAITKTRARSIAATILGTFEPNPATTKPAVALRLISSDSENPDVNGISTSPRLYWVAITTTGPLHRGGPMMSPEKAKEYRAQQERDMKNSVCRALTFIDATSGRAPTITQTCVPR